MNWLCWHVGTATDPKLRIVAKRCGVSLSVAVHLWAYLLEQGAESAERGHLGALDSEEIAVAMDSDEKTVSAVLGAMRDKGLITVDSIANWSKRQHKTSTERVKAWRENKKLGAPSETLHETHETVSETSETSETATDSTDRHTRQNSSSAAAPPENKSQIEAEERRTIGDRIVKICGGEPRNWMGDYGLISSWRAAGYDPDLDIYPTVERMAKRAGFKLKTLNYFTAAIEEAFRSRNRIVPEAQGRPPPRPARPQVKDARTELDTVMAKAGFTPAA